MSVTTVFPNMISGILTRLGQSSDLSGVRIFDGAEIDESYPGDAVAVGHNGNEGDTEMQIGAVNHDPLAMTDLHNETGQIFCTLWSWDGGSSVTARRVRAYALLSAVDTAIRTDPSFSGVCFYSWLSGHQVSYRQTVQGAAVVINFSISYTAQS